MRRHRNEKRAVRRDRNRLRHRRDLVHDLHALGQAAGVGLVPGLADQGGEFRLDVLRLGQGFAAAGVKAMPSAASHGGTKPNAATGTTARL